MSLDGQTRTVEIPEQTAEAIAHRLRATEFESIDQYVTVALEKLLQELDRNHVEPNGRAGSGASDHHSEKPLQQRLEALGYS